MLENVLNMSLNMSQSSESLCSEDNASTELESQKNVGQCLNDQDLWELLHQMQNRMKILEGKLAQATKENLYAKNKLGELKKQKQVEQKKTQPQTNELNKENCELKNGLDKSGKQENKKQKKEAYSGSYVLENNFAKEGGKGYFTGPDKKNGAEKFTLKDLNKMIGDSSSIPENVKGDFGLETVVKKNEDMKFNTEDVDGIVDLFFASEGNRYIGGVDILAGIKNTDERNAVLNTLKEDFLKCWNNYIYCLVVTGMNKTEISERLKNLSRMLKRIGCIEPELERCLFSNFFSAKERQNMFMTGTLSQNLLEYHTRTDTIYEDILNSIKTVGIFKELSKYDEETKKKIYEEELNKMYFRKDYSDYEKYCFIVALISEDENLNDFLPGKCQVPPAFCEYFKGLTKKYSLSLSVGILVTSILYKGFIETAIKDLLTSSVKDVVSGVSYTLILGAALGLLTIIFREITTGFYKFDTSKDNFKLSDLRKEADNYSGKLKNCISKKTTNTEKKKAKTDEECVNNKRKKISEFEENNTIRRRSNSVVVSSSNKIGDSEELSTKDWNKLIENKDKDEIEKYLNTNANNLSNYIENKIRQRLK